MAVVLDSDAVVGFLDRSDALHGAADEAIRRLIGNHHLLVSTVTYAEVLTGARLGRHDEDQVRGFFFELTSGILSVDVEIAEKAAGLRARHKSLRMPDALILATAEIAPEVELVLTGDRQLERVSGLACQVQVIS
ncbi:MAG TPA: PIN domain-containing protein [Solirubrobacterales bacterium]|nr:PIN domain-containing protein [Solirubrobacterales bacterium]